MPSDPHRIDHALALAADGNTGEADTLLEHLARQDQDPTAAWHLGWLRLRAGNAEGALAALLAFPGRPAVQRACAGDAGRRAPQRRGPGPAPAGAARRGGPARAGVRRHRPAPGRRLRRRGRRLPRRPWRWRRPMRPPTTTWRARCTTWASSARRRPSSSAPCTPTRAIRRPGTTWPTRCAPPNRLERACEALEQALALAPGYRSARLNLGITLFAHGRAGARAGLLRSAAGARPRRRRGHGERRPVPAADRHGPARRASAWSARSSSCPGTSGPTTTSARSCANRATCRRRAPRSNARWRCVATTPTPGPLLHAVHAEAGDEAAAEAALASGLAVAARPPAAEHRSGPPRTPARRQPGRRNAPAPHRRRLRCRRRCASATSTNWATCSTAMRGTRPRTRPSCRATRWRRRPAAGAAASPTRSSTTCTRSTRGSTPARRASTAWTTATATRAPTCASWSASRARSIRSSNR